GVYQRQYCILIVDDEEMIREPLSDFFSEEGYRVLTAQNAEEAMHALGRKPDLVLLDINMPGTDGLTFCRQI
ncbi:response regulator, partial [Clostridium butyricum]|nr:response regulator [Clostridium butyricum]